MTFYPVTPNDPSLTFDPTKVEVFKIMHMHESHDQAIQYELVRANLVKMTF